jgi:hypothetical protein
VLRVVAMATVAMPLLVHASPVGVSAGARRALQAPRGQVVPASEGRYYPQTGHTLAGVFLDFFDAHGGVPVLGFPLSEARMENGFLVQWTERQRLEWHPENAGTDYEVQLGLLGRELTRGLQGSRFTPRPSALDPPVMPSGPQLYFQETGHSVAGPFLDYWQGNGGLRLFGYPISTVFRTDEGLLIQWFERARFELHPELPPGHQILLGRLGYELLNRLPSSYYVVQVYDSPVPDVDMQLGLAQGGESDDPAFLDNVRDEAARLGPGLVRLDNIFNFYHVVQRGADGSIHYYWAELDRVLDTVRAMGKEPFICLSYMPELLAADGTSRVVPPVDYAEWADLVRATVIHVNVERRLGVRYWEVWNEPDQWGFWKAAYADYLRLYDVSVDAARSADPGVRVGGPAVAYFSPGHIAELLEHQARRGPAGRVDFISWHSYGRSPDELAADIRQARDILSRYPQFNPQLFITEFNVRQGGVGDTSANGYTDTVHGAVQLLASLEVMRRERLDGALVFELKDGRGPGEFWGRWGILTYNGKAKPLYYVLQAYLARPAYAFPVLVPVREERDGVGALPGVMAFGDYASGRLTVLVWRSGESSRDVGEDVGVMRIKLALPPAFAGERYTLALFDDQHNNPARTGDDAVHYTVHEAGDLVFDLPQFSVALVETGR